MMTMVIKRKVVGKILIKHRPVAVWVHVCCEYVCLHVCVCVCVLCHVALGQIFPLKDGIYSGLFLKSPKIYRTEEFAIFVLWVLLLIGVAPGCPQAIGKCAWMCNCVFACVCVCVYVTVADTETRDIRFKLPQRGWEGEISRAVATTAYTQSDSSVRMLSAVEIKLGCRNQTHNGKKAGWTTLAAQSNSSIKRGGVGGGGGCGHAR